MLRDIRKQYTMSALDFEDLDEDPMSQFNKWMKEVLNSDQLEPTAMILSTVNEKKYPQSRVVLLKELVSEGFVFYTNYKSKKAIEISQSNHVSLLFFWPSLEREVRIEGVIDKVSATQSDSYFRSRPVDSQLAAWASEQSSVIPSATYLQERFDWFKSAFKGSVQRPDHWGGYIVTPYAFEFWQGKANRLHDRFYYKQNERMEWEIYRLSP